MNLVVGIVAEGSTDIVVLEQYLSECVARQDASITVEVVPVQPTVDATSGRFGDGGWTRVKEWCEEYSTEDSAQHLFSPVLEGEQALDFLIVQLDGDAIDMYTADCPDITVPDAADAQERGQIVEQVLERWLWGSNEQRAKDPVEELHCLVASIRTLEAWLIAGLDASIEDPEELEDPERELMNLVPELETKIVAGVTRLKKMTSTWQGLAERTREALPHIRATCAQCAKFLMYVEARLERRRMQIS